MNLLYANDRKGAYPDSWYAATSEIPAARPALEGDISADICIIGAGYTGLSAALHLAQRGYQVVVLEAQRVGFGASGRNGGQVGSGFNKGQEELARRMGPDTARQLWDLAEEAKVLTRDLVARYAPEASYRPGVAYADWHASEVSDSHAEARFLQETYGYDQIDCLSRDEMRALVKSPGYHGGTLDHGSGHLHPLRYALGLAKAAEHAGPQIFEESQVVSLQKGAPNTVITKQGRVTAPFVIVACNGYLGDLEQKTAARVMPINNFIAATEPLGDRAAEVIAQDIAVADSKFVINYYRLSEDKRLLFGGGESYGYRFPQDIATTVRKPMETVFPQLKGVEITHAWGGTLAITLSRLPHFARVTDTILTASGYSGHGVALASLGGKILAEAIAGQAERFDLLATLPTPSFPGGSAFRSPLLALAMTWYAMRDRLGI